MTRPKTPCSKCVWVTFRRRREHLSDGYGALPVEVRRPAARRGRRPASPASTTPTDALEPLDASHCISRGYLCGLGGKDIYLGRRAPLFVPRGGGGSWRCSMLEGRSGQRGRRVGVADALAATDLRPASNVGLKCASLGLAAPVASAGTRGSGAWNRELYVCMHVSKEKEQAPAPSTHRKRETQTITLRNKNEPDLRRPLITPQTCASQRIFLIAPSAPDALDCPRPARPTL